VTSWRWWLSLGAFPLWLAVLELAWAAANLASIRRLNGIIVEARETGILPAESGEVYPARRDWSDDPWVRAAAISSGQPDGSGLLDEFAFRWDTPPDAAWLPLIRGWVRASGDDLEAIRRASAAPSREEDLPEAWTRLEVRGGYPLVSAWTRRKVTRLAFAAARLARLDGHPEAPARLVEAVRVLRLWEEAVSGPCDSLTWKEVREAAALVEYLLEGDHAGSALPDILPVLRGLRAGVFRRKQAFAGRLTTRARLETFVNEPLRFIPFYRLEMSGDESDPRSRADLERFGFLAESPQAARFLMPWVRNWISREARAWVAEVRTSVCRSGYQEAHLRVCDQYLAMIIAGARLRVLPGEPPPDARSALAGFPADLAAQVSVQEDAHEFRVVTAGPGGSAAEARVSNLPDGGDSMRIAKVPR
jgi:hypothetical protein